MKNNLFRSASFLCLLSAPLLANMATDASGGEIRVMSFNIRYGTAADGENHWSKRKDFVAETVLAFAPDLLGTQETIDFQKSFLETQMPQYTSVGVGRNDGGKKGEMTAIFFKTDRFELLDQGHFWLSETPDVAGSKSWDSSLPRVASWVKLKDRESPSARPILFLNTHFDHRGPQARKQSAGLLIKKTKQFGAGCDVVITADFNAGADSDPYQVLFETQDRDTGQPLFTDTYAVAGRPDERGEGTFSRFQAGKFKGARIDWIAVSQNWKVLQAEIDRTARDGRTPSDHYPVTAVLVQTAR